MNDERETVPPVTVSFGVTEELKKELTDFARAHDLTISQVMRRAVRQVLEDAKAPEGRVA